MDLGRARVLTITMIYQFTQGNSKRTKDTAWVPYYTITIKNMKVDGRTTKSQARASIHTPMAVIIRAILKMVREVAKAYLIITKISM